MEAQDDNIFELDFVIRSFQNAMMKIKYSTKPVVAAPFGMTLGGEQKFVYQQHISRHHLKRIWGLWKQGSV